MCVKAIQGLLEYARSHNYSTELIDIHNDVLVVANVNSSLFIPICLFFFL